ncbi:MAG: threonine aldolase family protein, partial [Gemmatimonadota bacterium]
MRSEVDLRSDTVTRPTPAMRDAMAAAEVGDDLLDGDPTTRRLEERVAELLGTETALFFPSGTMANQTALATLGRWGGEAVVESAAHVFHYEEGAAAALSGLQLHPVATPDGVLTPEHLASGARPPSPYLPRTALVCVENTHLASGGTIVMPESLDALGTEARKRGLPVHMDGARLWHAAAETGLPLTDFTRSVDTVMTCLSKGLGAPVGSMLAGPRDVLQEAWRIRRRLGGAMRQSGILAAAGLHALEHHRERLVEDHRRAQRIAEVADGVDGIEAPRPATNIVMLRLGDDAR